MFFAALPSLSVQAKSSDAVARVRTAFLLTFSGQKKTGILNAVRPYIHDQITAVIDLFLLRAYKLFSYFFNRFKGNKITEESIVVQVH